MSNFAKKAGKPAVSVTAKVAASSKPSNKGFNVNQFLTELEDLAVKRVVSSDATTVYLNTGKTYTKTDFAKWVKSGFVTIDKTGAITFNSNS
jgi:aspartate-semialdehyde dehydrogenase